MAASWCGVVTGSCPTPQGGWGLYARGNDMRSAFHATVTVHKWSVAEIVERSWFKTTRNEEDGFPPSLY